MTQDDIFRIAEEAGFEICRGDGWPDERLIEKLMCFAAGAAAHEREAIIHIIETYRIPVGNSAAGEMACEWTYNALYEIRDHICQRGEQ